MGVHIFAWVALGLVLANSAAWAQTGTASIYGDVVDPKGLAVVGAKVTLTNVDTKATRTTETDSTGIYLFPALPPGKYNLRVEMAGFRSYARRSIEILVNTTARVNAQLEVGGLDEIVQVSEATALLNTTDATMGNVITPQQVMSLPLEARDPAALLSLQAGVVFSGDPNDIRSGSASGARSDQGNFTLDGVDINDQQKEFFFGGVRRFSTGFNAALQVPLESIQEFRLTTSNPNADQGRSSGGQVGFITKSGTNAFHGSLFWTHRNTITTANDFFNNRSGVNKPKLIRNQFGGSVGGPILKERFFFFLTYEGTRTSTEFLETRIVPTASLRDGVLLYRCATASACPGGTVTGLTRTFTVPAGHFGLAPADIRTIDPAGLGVNSGMLPVLRGFPTCNDFTLGLDSTGSAPGLNFCGFRFNAPIGIRNDVGVVKLDYNLTRDAKHILSWRGTLGDLARDFSPQPFPGQPSALTLFDNSNGFSTSYSAQLLPNVTTLLRFGLTHQGRAIGGQSGPAFSIRSFDRPFSSNRGIVRQVPTYNLAEDFTWVRRTHTFTFGTNIRWIRNQRQDFANSFAAYAINDGFCAGLCNSVPNSLGPGRTFPQFPAVPGTFRNPFKRAIMGLYGTITQIGSSFLNSGTSQALVTGDPVRRRFEVNEYEFYGQDSWRIMRDLILTFGLRYGYYGVPHESNGLQTQPILDIQNWFAARVQAMNAGLPSANVPVLSWDKSGPANGKPGYYRPDKNNFAPNVSFAYSPGFKSGWFEKIFGGPGKSVIRGGDRVVYDRIGGAFVISLDQEGAVGLVTNVQNRAGALSYSSAPRFSGFSSLPPVANFVSGPPPGFPSTPACSISNRGLIVDNRLRTPYSYALDFSYGRQLRGGIGLEVSYVGRLGHKLLAKADLGAPLIYLRDPVTGTTYAQAINLLYDRSNQGSLPASAIGPIPYFENLCPGRAGTCGPSLPNCTATQGAYLLARTAFPSFTDSLNNLEGFSKLAFPAFFQQQFDSLPAWTNMGSSNYHALQVVVRKRFRDHLLFDVNYTWSKSIDNASVVENTDRLGGQIADAFFPHKAFAVSSFDIKHQMSGDWVYELPFGRGRWLGHDGPGWANQIIGGWQTSGIIRWRGAFPIALENGFNFPTNFFLTGPGTQICPINTNLLKTASGGPNLFGDTAGQDAAFACLEFTRSGSSGSRNSIRGVRYFNLDFGLRKTFRLPMENHKIVFDWHVFNLFNHANFDDRDMRTNPESRSTFGRYVSTIGGDERANNGRVMQFSLRYEF